MDAYFESIVAEIYREGIANIQKNLVCETTPNVTYVPQNSCK